MRSAIIGAYFSDDPIRRRDFVLACSRLTHRSWQAETAALAVAECAAYGQTRTEPPGAEFFNSIASLSLESEWQNAIAELQRGIAAKLPVREFAAQLGLSNGVTGYSLHVALVAMYSWSLHWNDFRSALVSVLDCGGDTDTAGAIVGAIAGSATTTAGIPDAWTDSIVEWPRSTKVMSAIAKRVREQQQCAQTMGPVQYFWPGVLIRNAFFLLIVLFHGFRRVFPPY
jgi:ADP-ribosylglycohydrolase